MKIKTLHIILIISLLVFCQNIAIGQIALDWVKRDVLPLDSTGAAMGSSGADIGVDVALDGSGNVYSVNSYTDGGGIRNFALYKLNKFSDVQWKASISGQYSTPTDTTPVHVIPGAVITGNSGVYVVGYNLKEATSQTPTIGEIATEYKFLTKGVVSTVTVPTSASTIAMKGFIAKYNFSGDLMWVNTLQTIDYNLNANGPSTESIVDINDIAVDDLENVYIVGSYSSDSLHFCDTCIINTSLKNPADTFANPNGKKKAFVAKYTSSGAYQYDTRIQFSESTSGYGIVANGTELYVCGEATGDLIGLSEADSVIDINSTGHIRGYNNYDNPSGSFDPAKDFRTYGFVIKYSTSGSMEWTGKLGGNNNESAYDIIAQNGRIYVALLVSSVTTDERFAADDIDTTYLRTGTSYSSTTQRVIGDSLSTAAYLIKLGLSAPIQAFTFIPSYRKYDKLVPVDWVQGLESEEPIQLGRGSCLSSDADDNIYMIATQQSSCDYFSGDIFPSYGISTVAREGATVSTLTEDMVLTKYRDNGDRLYTRKVGNTGSDYATGCAANLEQFVVTGKFLGTTDFEPNPAITNSYTSYGGLDAFVAQYACFKPDLISTNDAFCENSPIDLQAIARCPSNICNYTYEWIDPVANTSFTSPGKEYTFSGVLGTNSRIVNMTDGNTGCITSDTIVVNVQPEIVINSVTSPSGPLCAGTNFTFSASAGSLSGINYTWYNASDLTTTLASGNSFTTDITGSYSVIAERLGCSDLASVALNNYAAVSPLITPETPYLCGGGSILEVVDCPGCSYAWTVPPGSNTSSASNTITADVAGRYIVDITDQNGCTYQRESDVINQPFLSPAIYAQNSKGKVLNTICNGRPLTVFTTSPIDCPTCSYLWNDGSTGPYNFAYNAGVFTVTVTDNATGCIGVTAPLNITATTINSPVVVGDPYTRCGSNAELKVTNPCTYCDYDWYRLPKVLVRSSSLIHTTATNGDYFAIIQDSFGCEEPSNIVTVDDGVASVPPISTTANTLCGTNTAEISTTYCPSCTYEWYYYDAADTQKLMISGVFSGPNSGEPKGIELYAVADIPDLSRYSVGLVSNGGGLPPSPIYNGFPAISVNQGTYIHIANNSTTFNNYFGFAPDYQNGVANVNGNDAIVLAYDASVVDVFGDVGPTAVVDTTNWGYNRGWTYRNNNTAPSPTFTVGQWSSGGTDLLDTCSNNTLCDNPVPLRTFTTNAVASNDKRLIVGEDSFKLITSIPNTYFVEIQYPNSCYGKSADIDIDTASFNPVIIGQTPKISELDSKTDPFYTPPANDTVYSCNGRDVEIFMTGTFAIPPTWSYQWLYNGLPIPGETGYRIVTDSIGEYTVQVINRAGCVAISNSVHVLLSTVGANPQVVANPGRLCSPTIDSSDLITLSCPTCAYLWKDESNTDLAAAMFTDTMRVGRARGYFVITTDSNSLCSYASPIVEVKDTLFPAPTITPTSNPSCATNIVQLQTTACANCAYVWEQLDTTGGLNTWLQIDSVTQNLYPIDSSGEYRMKIVNFGSCETEYSNIIRATFQDISAAILTPPITSICNGDSVIINAIPNSTNCPLCSYVYLRDGVPMQPDLTLSAHQQKITAAGDYEVVVINADGCQDTSSVLTFQDVSVSTGIRQSTAKICGPSSCVKLEVDSCVGCSYQWYLGGIPLAANRDTFVNACGYAAIGEYVVDVVNGGCVVSDTIQLDSAAAVPLLITIDSSVNQYPTICGPASVFMLDTCQTCALPPVSRPYYQWYRDGVAINLAGFESYQADSAGNYQLEAIDTNNCQVLSNIITVQRFDPNPAFALDFSPLGPAIPFTYGTFSMDDYLMPSSLRTNPTGVYSSLTADPAINLDSLTPSTAGSGFHQITFSYDDGDCTFSTSDTIEVLDPMGMTLTNRDTLAPINEACILDILDLTLTNFTFIPDSVLFVTDTGIIAVAVSPALTTFAGVYSGTFPVRVPNSARTGKIILKDNGGTNVYLSPNFLAVQNPTSAIDLDGVTPPLCSSDDSVGLVGVPVGGIFEAHYIGSSNNPELIRGDSIILDSVAGYDINGIQNIYAVYVFTPTYSNGLGACPQVRDSLLLEVRDSEVDSVKYSPIAISQTSESMNNLRRVVYPFTSMKYNHSYTGTYVLSGNVLPNTVDSIGNQDVTYTINNGGCTNSVTDSVDVWPAPAILDSIPSFLCRSGDTLCIERNMDSLKVTYRGQLIYSDTLYKYRPTYKVFLPNLTYDEQLNIMEITSSNGGLDSVNFVLPSAGVPQKFNFIPADVIGNNTTLTFRFKNIRRTTDLTALPIPVTDTIDYIVAEVQKNIVIETPPTVAINPVVLADTNFCPIDLPIQMTGIPSGGQFYFGNRGSNSPIVYDSLESASGNKNIFNAIEYPFGESYDLTYVYHGLACIDSAHTGVYIPDTFSINLEGLAEYCATSPVDTISFSLPYGYNPANIDSTSAQFYVGGIQSSPYFTPVQTFPSGSETRETFLVQYRISDIYGCQERDDSTFYIYPLPNIAIDFPLDTQYCLNDPATDLTMSVNYWWQPTTSTQISHTANYSQGQQNVSMIGAGVENGGAFPSTPFFEPDSAGVGIHWLTYSYADSLGCTDSINMKVEVLPLPVVSLTEVSGTSLRSYYCENDTVSLAGSPQSVDVNYFGFGYYTNDNSLGPRLDTLSASVHKYTPYIPGTVPGVLYDTLYYWFEIAATGCRDTAFSPVLLRNFTTDPSIVNYPDTTCASDEEITVSLNLNGGLPMTGYGLYASPDSGAFYMPTPLGEQVLFYPDSAGIKYGSRNVRLVYHYTDTSGLCRDSIADTSFVRALPELFLSEVPFINDPIGTKLIAPPTDTFEHLCQRYGGFDIYAHNQTGEYDALGNLTVYPPDLISPDTGTYNIGQSGVDTAGTLNGGGSSFLAYNYDPLRVPGGNDTVHYTYTDMYGCTDSIKHIVVVDTIPDLSFAGLGNYDASIDRYVYCETEPNPPVILPSPIGVEWAFLFNGDTLTSVPFKLRPDTLAVPGVYVDYPLDYYYIGQRYVNGMVCNDTLTDTIEIRPAPQMAWATGTPTHFCVLDSLQRLPLSATPYGGQYIDNTFGVSGGIVSDSLFVPTAQAGKRDLVYYYLDPVSGCDDTINHTLFVYTMPRIAFDIQGGCQGNQVDFVPNVSGLEYNGVAIDSLTMVIWNFGDGVIDTIAYLPDTIVVPQDTHTYVGSGVFYPSLTVWNQGVCDTTFTRRIVISPLVSVTNQMPYFQDFESPTNGWYQESADSLSLDGIVTDSLWQWGVADGQNLNTTIDGNHVWGTRILNPANVTYGQGENAWVYSPCFDVSTLERPMIQLSLLSNMQKGIDGTVMQYYDNDSLDWVVLGKPNKGINWYYDGYVVSGPGEQTGVPIGWTDDNYVTGWENSRYRLDNVGNDLRGRKDVRFRLAFASDPNTLLNMNEGVLFDSVKIGNRRKNVLVEHFSGVGYGQNNNGFYTMEYIDNALYNTLFNSLYGRDVSLIQYHTNMSLQPQIPGLDVDSLYLFNTIDVNDRILDYSITDNNQVRLNGQDLVGKTSELLNYTDLEYLDIQSLQDAKFDIRFMQNPVVYIDAAGNLRNGAIEIEALEDLPYAEYALRTVVTEDSLETVLNHKTLAVMRHMLPTYTGIRYAQLWTKGDVVQQTITGNVDATKLNLLNTEIVIFMQNVATKEVYQVASTRAITAWRGAVDSIDVSIDDLPELQEWEVINLNLYPNPAQDYFNVEFTQALEGDYDWKLVDAVGRVLKSGEATQGTEILKVETRDIPTGMYIFTINNSNIYTQRKVIISKP